MTARAEALCVGSVHGEIGAIPCNCEAIEAALVRAGRDEAPTWAIAVVMIPAALLAVAVVMFAAVMAGRWS